MLRSWLLAVSLLVSSASMAAPIDAEFIDLNGKTVKLSDFRGKWVVVNYWATWCPPCVKEIPELVAFHEAHAKKDAVVLGVNHQEDAIAEVKKFADDRFVNYPVVRSKGKLGSGTPFGTLKGLPTTFMVTPEGEVVAARTGLVDQAVLEKFINDNSKK